MSNMHKQSSAMLHTTQPVQPVLAVDLIKLNRLHKWLTGFFIATVGVIVVLYSLPAENMTTEISAIIVLALNVGVWGYYITLGRMASTLHKSVIMWVGGSMVLNIFGFSGSLMMMHSRVQDARKNEAGRAGGASLNV